MKVWGERQVGRARCIVSAAVEAGAGHKGRGAVQVSTVGEVRASPSTVSTARFAVASGLSAPSQTTMAPPARLRPDGTTMPAIAQARRTYEHTQHWPEHGARTSAPCHTPLAAPPGLATRLHWKPAPVGPYLEHDDENRNANRVHGAAWNGDVPTAICVTRVATVWVHMTASGEHERALTDVASPGLRPPAHLVTASPPPAVLTSLRPVASGLLVSAPLPDRPDTIVLPVVVCVIAEPAANENSVTHTITFENMVTTDSTRPNADVIAIAAILRKGQTPAFARNPIRTAYSISSVKANRSAERDEAAEYAVAALPDVSEDIVLARAIRDGVAHFYDDLSGSRISMA